VVLHDQKGSAMRHEKTEKRVDDQERKKRNKQYHDDKKRRPWAYVYNFIMQRCVYDKNHKYYKKGIKCEITREELKTLWYRDKAYSMERPSIDRIKNDGNYRYSNCRFIELRKNSGRFNAEKTHCPSGHPYSGDNLYVFKGVRQCRICCSKQSIMWNKTH
jgi:hypothetical protein